MSKPTTIEAYEQTIPEKWRLAYFEAKETLLTHIPAEFELVMQYNMPTFVVPLAQYPQGYLGRLDEPLPFISLAVQKHHLAVYHLGLLADSALLTWFTETYTQVMPTKLNMGKSCIRFTNPKKIPYELIGQLAEKITVATWIQLYEQAQRK